MGPLVVDASAVCELLLQREQGPRVEKLAASHPLYAPDLLTVEVMSVLQRWQRSGQISKRRAYQALADLLDLPITLVGTASLVRAAWGVRENVSAHDAMYVALAEALGCRLLTFDKKLARAIGALAA